MAAEGVRSSAPPFTLPRNTAPSIRQGPAFRLFVTRIKDIWLPVFAGEYTPAECMGRDKYMIDGKEYDECAFCRASCPSRDLFKEPDSGLPLKCDMCEDDPPLRSRCALSGASTMS